MIQNSNETAWEHYQALNKDGSGMEHYICAEFVAMHRAMQTLKQSNGTPISFRVWVSDAVEFVENMKAGISCKYRDFVPVLLNLEKLGCLRIVGDLDEDWNEITVQITPKGFLATPQEWWQNCDVKFEEVVFRPEQFSRSCPE